MKKISSIIILATYALALYCLSFMSAMPSSAMSNMMADMGNASAMEMNMTMDMTSDSVRSSDSPMICENCWSSQMIMSVDRSSPFSLVIAKILVMSAFILLVTGGLMAKLRRLMGRSPPPLLLFKDHFLRQNQTVVLRN